MRYPQPAEVITGLEIRKAAISAMIGGYTNKKEYDLAELAKHCIHTFIQCTPLNWKTSR